MKLLGKKIYRVALKPQKNGLGMHNRDSEGNYITSGTRSGCCVHPDTRISMADGTTKAAKDVRVGDELITQAGTGKVQIITNPELGYRSLYSYGRGSYFITGDHPIHADGEWKSLMPGFSKLDYGVECTRLEKGAVLTLINGDKVKLEKIEGETNNPNLVLYDFHMDGDEDANHTYFANGLLVHNGGGGGGGGGGGCRSSSSSNTQGYYDDTGAYNYGSDYAQGGKYYEPDDDPAPTPAPAPSPPSVTPSVDLPGEIVGGGDGAGVEDAFDVDETGGDPQDEAENMGGTTTDPEDTTTGSSPQDQTSELQDDGSFFGEFSEDTTQQDFYDQDDADFQDSLDQAMENTQDLDDGSFVENQTDTFDEDFSFDSDFDDDSVIDPTKPDQIDISGQTGDQIDSQTLTGEDIDDAATDSFLDSMDGQFDVDQDGQDDYENYVMDLQIMFDDPDQRGDLTVNELNTLREEGYITGDPEDTVQSGQGQTGDITDVTHTPTSDLASTLDKVQAGVPLGQTDYENISQKPLGDRLEIYQQMSTGTLEDALDFSNLTNTSVVPYLTEENIEFMGETGDGLDTLSWEDKKELMGQGGSLTLSASVLFDMDPAERKDYFDLKFGYDEKGIAPPDPTADPEGYKNYIALQNDMIDKALKNDPAFMNARVNAWAEHLGDKGLNVGKGVLMKMARGMLNAQMRDIVGGAVGGVALAAGANPLVGMAAGMVTSKIYAKLNKEAQKKFHEQAQKMGLTPQQAIQVNDSLADYEASPEGQQYIDNFVQSDEFQQQLFENHALSQGFVYDPNALNGEGAYTAIYGYDEDGLPLSRPEALNMYGQGHVDNIEQGYQNSGINFTYTGTSGEQLDDAGPSFSDDSLGQSFTNNKFGDLNQDLPSGGGGGFKEKDKDQEEETVTDLPSEDEGDDDMGPTTGGSSNERWERFMEMMEKRARGEAPSLTEEAMRKEREEGLKERMAVMAMGRGQPTAAGLRQYDRAKGAADAELARDAALTRLKEQRLAQEQYGQALTDQMDRESRERMGTEKLEMDKQLKQMDAQTAKDKGWFNFWKELGAGAFLRYGNKIDEWIAAGWDKLTAEEQIKANGDEPDSSGGDDGQGWGGGDTGQGFTRPANQPGYTEHDELPSYDDHGYWEYNSITDEWEFKLWDEFHDGGRVEGPGSETSDDIPALLSDGEFVINARTVRGLGRSQGANNKKEERERGVQFLEQLQKDFGEKDEVSFGDVLIARRGL